MRTDDAALIGTFMDIPIDKTQLLERIIASRAELDALIAPLADAQLTAPGAEGDRSVKDLLAHVAWWERRTLTALAHAGRGEGPPRQAAEGEGPEGVDRVNEETFLAQRGRPLAEVRAEYRQAGADLIAAIEGFSEADLFDPDGLTRYLGFPAVALIAGDTYMHYADHVASIRAWLAAGRENDRT